MIELINKNLNIHQLLKEKLDVFKEIFIEYYGEESREFIEYKFSHLATIGFVPTDDIQSYLYDVEKELSNNILSKYDFSTFPLSEEELFDKNRLEHYTLMPIGGCEDFIDYIKVDKNDRKENYKNFVYDELGKHLPNLSKEEFEIAWQNGQFPDEMNKLPLWIQNRIKYICSEDGYKNEVDRMFNRAKPLLEKLYPGINTDNFNQLLEENSQITDQLIKLSDTVRACKEEYEEQKKEYAKYYDELNEKTNINVKLSNEYFRMFIIENFDIIPEDERENVKKALEENRLYSISDKVESYLGSGILSRISTPVYAFSTEAEEKLNSQETTSATKESILYSRVKFFKANGIDLGNDYAAYLENEEVRKIWPSRDRVDKLAESFDNIKNKYNNHLYTSLSTHKKLRAEIDQLGLLSKDDGFDAKMHTSPTTCVVTNLKDGPEGPEMFPLVFVIPNKEGKYTDHKIIHELNHVIELSLTSIGENTYDAVCGWDIVEGTYNDTKQDADTINDRKIRPYEMINEVINEAIAQEISELMHSKGIIIADDKEKTSYIGCTSYERTFFIVKDFYKEFKEVIIKSRRNGNIQALFDEVGKDNFEELNNLFTTYKENFNEFSFGRTLMDRKAGNVTEKTKILEDILIRRDKILDKMRMHSAMRQSQNEVLQEEKTAQI